MNGVKENLEKTAFKLEEAGSKVVLGKKTLTAGEAILTLIGLGVAVYGLVKLEGQKKVFAVLAGFGIVFIGECLW